MANEASVEGLITIHAMNVRSLKLLYQTEIPRCVYTHPEIASFGLKVEKAKNADYDVKVTTSSLAGNAKTIAIEKTEVLSKLSLTKNIRNFWISY